MKSSFYTFVAVSALAATSVAYVVAAPAEAATPFKDIPANSSHKLAIDALYNQGIITGRMSTAYEPNKPATRGETAFFIANALGLNIKNVTDPGFADVKKTHPYYGAIAALYKAGIISGSTSNDGKKLFTPNGTVKRAHIGKMLTLGFELDVASQSNTKFVDVNSINHAETRKYIQTLVDYGITVGTSANMFSPYKDVSRAQLATFLYRTLNAVEDEELVIVEVE